VVAPKHVKLWEKVKNARLNMALWRQMALLGFQDGETMVVPSWDEVPEASIFSARRLRAALADNNLEKHVNFMMRLWFSDRV